MISDLGRPGHRSHLTRRAPWPDRTSRRWRQ